MEYNSSSNASDIPDDIIAATVNGPSSSSSLTYGDMDIGDYFWSISDWQAWYNSTISGPCEMLPLTPGTQIFLGIVFALITLICGLGNTLLCFIIFTQKRLRTVTNLLIANLAVSDAMVALLCAPFSLHYYLHQDWIFGELMCPLVGTIKFVSLFVSVNTLLVIAADRYHGIFRPLRPRMRKSTLVIIVVFIWLISILAAFPAPLFTRVTSGECDGAIKHACFELWYNTMALKAYTVLITVVEFLLPMWIMAFIYLSIAMKLWSHRTPPGNVTERHREITFVRKQKTIPMLVTLVVAFFLSWAPYYGYNLAFTFFQEDLESNFEYRYSMLYAVEGIAMLNSVISTVIYFIMSPVFRKELSAVYASCFHECPPKLRRSKAVLNKSTGSNSSSHALKSNNHIRKITVDTIDTKI
ncbi:prokineticin receptor 2-like [Amphiura filiformis]|uniref:prokineticin receptor 2-like n=1 Tax=Amphiura filiformis TaxID=82378 RepID=UPI003B224AD8